MIHGGVITYLEPDILECEVKGALGTIIMNKASGVKAFDCVITTNCETFLKRWEHQTTLPASWETCMQVKKQQLEQNMEQQTGSRLGKECVRAVYCHSAYLTYMQSISCEMRGWMKHRLESRIAGRIISNLR